MARLHDLPTSASRGSMQLTISAACATPPQSFRTSASQAREEAAACVSLVLQGSESVATCKSKHA